MAEKPYSIRCRFARRYLSKGCYRRLRRDAKRTVARRRRRLELGNCATKGCL